MISIPHSREVERIGGQTALQIDLQREALTHTDEIPEV